jgi:hypothetical protein
MPRGVPKVFIVVLASDTGIGHQTDNLKLIQNREPRRKSIISSSSVSTYSVPSFHPLDDFPSPNTPIARITMSKQLPPATAVDDNDAPPSYTDTVLSTPLPNPLATLLSNLPTHIRHGQTQLVNTQREQDNLILVAILPCLEAFVSSPDIATAPSGVSELVLIPASAVDEGWSLTGLAERQSEGDVVHVAHVMLERGDGDGEKTDGKDGGWRGEESSKRPSNNWFADEAMARRLAGYLQPKEAVKTERRDVRAEVEQTRKEKGFFGLGRKRSEASTPASSPGCRSQAEKTDDGVSVRAQAEEITFRKENDFGIWESMSGFGIVVTVRVRKV